MRAGFSFSHSLVLTRDRQTDRQTVRQTDTKWVKVECCEKIEWRIHKYHRHKHIQTQSNLKSSIQNKKLSLWYQITRAYFLDTVGSGTLDPTSLFLKISNFWIICFLPPTTKQETEEYSLSDLVLRYIDPDYSNISQP